jgi:outer membrane immunogenic protein
VRIGITIAIGLVLIGLSHGAVAADSSAPFSGSYVGVNAGAAWGNASYATNPNCPPATVQATFCDSSTLANGAAVAASGTGHLSPTGFTGGVQAGHNWQVGTVVYGGEVDLGAFDLSQSATASAAFPPSAFVGTQYTVTESMKADWLATLRARLGVTVTPQLLLYATGGLAFSEVKFSSGYSDNAIGPNGGIFLTGGTGFGSRSELRTGWTAGGGGELLLDRNWSLKFEYLFVDLGSISVLVPTSNTPTYAQTMEVNSDLTAQIARIGFNYLY